MMIKLISFFYLFSALLDISHSDDQVTFDNLTFIIKDLEPLEEDTWFDSEHPNKCHFRAQNHYWNAGEHYGPAKQCWIAKCVKPGHVSILSCGVVNAAEDSYTNRYCHSIGMDFSRPYPGCCSRYLCRSKNSSMPYIYNPLVPGGGKESSYYKRWSYL